MSRHVLGKTSRISSCAALERANLRAPTNTVIAETLARAALFLSGLPNFDQGLCPALTQCPLGELLSLQD